MELTKRNKLLLAVAGLGLVSVGVDQIFLGSGRASLASQQADAGGEAHAGSSPGIVRVVTFNPAAKQVGEQLRAFAPKISQQTPAGDDMFQGPATWFPASQPGAKQPTAPQTDPRVAEAERIAASLRLTSVALKPTATAVVNGVLLREGRDAPVKLSSGSELRVTLLSVEGPNREANAPGRAVLQVGSVRVTLQIAQPTQARPE